MLGIEAEAVVNSFLILALKFLIQVGEDIGTGHQRVLLLLSSSSARRTLDTGDEPAVTLGKLILLAVVGDDEPEAEEVIIEVHRAKFAELLLIHRPLVGLHGRFAHFYQARRKLNALDESEI